MLPAVFFGVANFMFGSIRTQPSWSTPGFSLSAWSASASSDLLSCHLLARYFGANGAASAFVLSEALLAILIVSRYLKCPADRKQG